MRNTPADESVSRARRRACLATASLALAGLAGCATSSNRYRSDMTETYRQPASSAPLAPAQRALVPVAALAAAGDMARLGPALDRALDASLTVSDAREALVQVYAYAGFPRSINALSELMRVLDARRQRGVTDDPGRAPSRPIPQGDALRAAGTANQTKLAGAPVKGALFDFAPALDEYLKVHLFGAIFERDNLDWPTRELATIGMRAALPGAEAQLQSHLRIGANVGLTAAQLGDVAAVLAEQVGSDPARRVREGLKASTGPK